MKYVKSQKHAFEAIFWIILRQNDLPQIIPKAILNLP